MSTPGKDRASSDADEPAAAKPSDEVRIKTKYGNLILADNHLHADFRIRILIKKISGNAVQRNYYKRVIRQYLRENRSRFKRYNDCVFYYHSKARISFQDIQAELNEKISGLS
jgi:ribonuclease P protein component